MEHTFNKLNDEKRRMDDDYKGRIESNLVVIASLRNEIDDQKNVLTDRKKQNADLYQELERQKDILDHRSVEIARLRADLQAQQDLNQSLLHQKKQLEDELYQLRERNREDAAEIERLTLANDQKAKESVELASRIRALEYDISKSLARIDDLNRIIEQKTYELKSKEQALLEAENECMKLKAQLASYQKELEHLRALEERYRQENGELQRRIDQESSRNAELAQLIKESESKIRVRED